MDVSRSIAERILGILSRYSPHVSELIIQYPSKRVEITDIFERDVDVLYKGIITDFGEGGFEALVNLLGIPSIGTSEVLGYLIERTLLAPLENSYYSQLSEYHPQFSGLLDLYKAISQLPFANKAKNIVPDKTLAAAAALCYDVWNVTKQARQYNKANYDKDYYSKEHKLGVPGNGEYDVHPSEPILSDGNGRYEERFYKKKTA